MACICVHIVIKPKHSLTRNMCGRTCLTLSTEQIKHACKYKGKQATTSSVVENVPEIRSEYNCGRNYTPSFNVAPTDVTPVLVSAAHFDSDLTTDRALVPMMWGMIPFWHTGNYLKHGLTTNNCRLETMLQSKLYKKSFRSGQRCVILCEGFYEWQTTKDVKSSEREAYYIYMPQNNTSVATDASDTCQTINKLKVEAADETKPCSHDAETKTIGDQHMKLLQMAGLFDMWTDENGNSIYSYTVITFESVENFSWMHHRSPAILESEQQVSDWLDFKRVTDEEALATLRPARTIIWHRVSNEVNSSRNKSSDCNKPIEMVQKRKLDKPNLLNSWLVRKKPKTEDEKEEAKSS